MGLKRSGVGYLVSNLYGVQILDRIQYWSQNIAE